jgi:hypothetical protein
MSVKREQHLLPRSYLKSWFDPLTVLPNKTPMVSAAAIREQASFVGEHLDFRKNIRAIRDRNVTFRHTPEAAGKSPPVCNDGRGFGFLVNGFHLLFGKAGAPAL